MYVRRGNISKHRQFASCVFEQILAGQCELDAQNFASSNYYILAKCTVANSESCTAVASDANADLEECKGKEARRSQSIVTN